ncbi:hypothetical protein [Klebsiella michiganensis]|uniref:hypothetical protein n=1 Tax=Klebsiella michiganensis TaxID=1134687 RepID=UPI0012B86687|nr:hypothetical protein [Klebsiella michiganensis]
MTSKLTITDDKLSALLSEMEKSFTRCQGHCYTDAAEEYGNMTSALRELQERRKAERDSEPVAWSNGCNKSVPAALRYLAEKPRTIGGESSFNTAHLYQLAREIEFMAEAPLYRHAQQPVVPEDIPDSVYEILCQACGGKAWMYEEALWNACRAAMLAAAQQEVPDGK